MKNLNDFENANDYIAHMQAQKQNNTNPYDTSQLTDRDIMMMVVKQAESYMQKLLAHVGLSWAQMCAVVEVEHDFSLKGRAGGQFIYYKMWKVNQTGTFRWNMHIIKNNDFEDYLNQVVGHEVCHLIIQVMIRQQFLYAKQQAHGYEWQKLMRVIGLKPERCHNYDTVRGKTKREHLYTTDGVCSCEYWLSTRRHNELKKGYKTKKKYGREFKIVPREGKTLYTCGHGNNLFYVKTRTFEAGK